MFTPRIPWPRARVVDRRADTRLDQSPTVVAPLRQPHCDPISIPKGAAL
jgi:hypothetical protein